MEEVEACWWLAHHEEKKQLIALESMATLGIQLDSFPSMELVWVNTVLVDCFKCLLSL